MEDREVRLLRSLLTETRVLTLGVIVEGAPALGLLPFAARPDLSGLVVHASRLARHSRGLADGAPFAVLMHAPDAPDGDPLQVPRVSLEGEVVALLPGSAKHEEARGLYVARFPSSEGTFALPDFTLYELRVQRGRLVGGFARAINLSLDTLRKAAAQA